MTVESILTKMTYAGNGSATDFPVPFTYSRAEDLYLLLTGADGTETPVASNFRVDVNASGDTSVTYPVSGTPLPAGQKLTIYRSTPQTQIVDLVYGGAFSPETLEHDGFDRLEMQIQELQEEVDRTVKVRISGTETPEELLQEVCDARDQSVAYATAAGQSAAAAAASETNAAASENSASASEISASGSASTAASHSSLARKWAENPEDEAVIPDRYSAYHWAKKALENSASGETLATVNGLEPDDDKNVPLTREVTQAEYDALQAAGTLSPGAEYVIADGVNASSLIVIGAGGTKYVINKPGIDAAQATADAKLDTSVYGNDKWRRLAFEVVFNGTNGAIISSINVNSVIRTAVGVYIINVPVPLSTQVYLTCGSANASVTVTEQANDGAGNISVVVTHVNDVTFDTSVVRFFGFLQDKI